MVSAKSAGLAAAKTELTSRAVEVRDGLGLALSVEGLPLFTVTRCAVAISSAAAGWNDAEVMLSYHDNEVISWTSSDDLATAWIEYRMEHAASLSEATFKFGGRRERAYPARILVD